MHSPSFLTLFFFIILESENQVLSEKRKRYPDKVRLCLVRSHCYFGDLVVDEQVPTTYSLSHFSSRARIGQTHIPFWSGCISSEGMLPSWGILVTWAWGLWCWEEVKCMHFSKEVPQWSQGYQTTGQEYTHALISPWPWLHISQKNDSLEILHRQLFLSWFRRSP